MARRFDAGYYFSEGFHSIFTHGFMSFAAVCMIVACLLIMGSFSLVAVNLNDMLGDLEDENQLAVYIDDSYTEEQARALEEELKAVPNVTNMTFVTRAEALDTYQQSHNNVELFEDLPDDVFRDRYYVHIADIAQMAQTKANLEQVEGVGDVVAAVEIAEGFVLVRNIATGVALVLVGILLVISLFIIANTIKLATFYRREEIAIMKMCGATNWFVRWPFIFEGMILGFIGALLAFLIQWGIYSIIVAAIAEYGGLQLIAIVPFKTLALRVLGAFAAAGLAIGAGGSFLAIRKFLQV